MDNNYFSIKKLPLDTSDLGSNAWLSGFIETDGGFYIRVTHSFNRGKSGKTKKIAVLLELTKKSVIINNYDNKVIMNKICSFLGVTLKHRNKYNQYWVKTNSLKSNIIIKNYLNKYPLWSCKHLDYECWKKVLFYMINYNHRDNLEKIIKLKNGMNNKRIYFNWNHLKDFYY
jgi:hypothetical protein